jgi:hypothetical protein
MAPPFEKPIAKIRSRSTQSGPAPIQSNMAAAKATSSVAGSVWQFESPGPALKPRELAPSRAVPPG